MVKGKGKKIQRIKIVVAMIASFALISFITPRVFVANTPTVQTQFLVWAKYMPQRVLASLRNFNDGEKRNNEIQTAQIGETKKEGLDYKPVASGVYAASDPESGEEYVKIDRGTELKIEYIKRDDGQYSKVLVPVSR